jgi:hypothetical protein
LALVIELLDLIVQALAAQLPKMPVMSVTLGATKLIPIRKTTTPVIFKLVPIILVNDLVIIEFKKVFLPIYSVFTYYSAKILLNLYKKWILKLAIAEIQAISESRQPVI